MNINRRQDPELLVTVRNALTHYRAGDIATSLDLPLPLGPVLRVDTSIAVDTSAVAEWCRSHALAIVS